MRFTPKNVDEHETELRTRRKEMDRFDVDEATPAQLRTLVKLMAYKLGLVDRNGVWIDPDVSAG